MYKKLKEVNNFHSITNVISSKLINWKNSKGDHFFDIDDVFNSSGLDNDEIDSILYHLKRGGIIESSSDLKSVKLSMYGEFMYRGFIKNGYVPFA